jgi:Domain of unknown function (DUF4328)
MSIDQADNRAVPAAEASGFRDPTTLTRWLKILLWTGIALAVISLGSGLMELKLLRDIQAGQTLAPGVADSNDLRQRIIGAIRFVEIVATIIVFAMWIYRANYNTRQLGATGMEYTPGWSVGWFFVPIANLFKPYLAMKEIWQASAAPANWKDQPRGEILPWWWGVFLFNNFLNQAALRLAMRADTVTEISTASTVSVVADGVDVVSSLIALVLVGQIYRMQMAHRASPAASEVRSASQA